MLVALGLLVAGCASPSPVGTPTTQVQVGTCKTLTTGEEMVTMSDVSPAVPCSGPHVYETYAVTSVPASISEFAERPGPELMQAQTQGACPYEPVRPYLGAGPLDSQWGISIWQKVPTRAEWSRNVRTLVCNLVVDNPDPHRVPRTSESLRGIMRYSDSARLRQCRGGSPLTNTTCSRPHSGEKMGTIALDPRLKPAARARAADRACTARVREYTGTQTVPGFASGVTEPGDGTVECWLNSTHGDVTGTERGGLVSR
jgi:hypothetical protein